MKQAQTRENRLGAGAWIWCGRYQLERYLYMLHRVTGLGLILFGIMNLTVITFFRIQGQGAWEAAMLLLNNPWFKIGGYLVAVAFVFHALNGLRLILQQLGIALGRPSRPVYPFKDTARKNRSWTVGLLAAIIILALLFLYDLVLGGR